MNKLIFTNKAVDDLSSIWEYTVRRWSASQAERYYNLLIDCCRMISESKITTSRRYDEVMAGLSGVRAGRHIIFYTISDSHCVTIVRILHERPYSFFRSSAVYFLSRTNEASRPIPAKRNVAPK